MKNLLLAISVILMFSLVSCAGKDIKPDWINGKIPSDTYPSSRYMIGIGGGSDLTSAQDKARAEIAKQFSVKVEALLQSLESYTGMEGNVGESWIMKTKVSDLVRTYTSETISGIEIKENYLDKESAQAYALAVLNRPSAMMRLEQSLMDLDFKIKTHVEASKSKTDKLQKLRPLLKALELVKEREIKDNQLSVINPVGAGSSPEVSAATLNVELNKILESIKVMVEVKGDGSDAVIMALKKSMNNGRLQIKKGTDAIDLIVKGKVEMVETEQGNTTGFTFVKIKASLELINTADNSTFGTIEHELRDGAKTWNDARLKTLNRLTRKIVLDFNNKLYAYLSL